MKINQNFKNKFHSVSTHLAIFMAYVSIFVLMIKVFLYPLEITLADVAVLIVATFLILHERMREDKNKEFLDASNNERKETETNSALK